MKVLYDTSIIVAGVIEAHERHVDAHKHLNRRPTEHYQICVAAHTLAEAYATLTRLPRNLRLSPQETFALIQESVIDAFDIVGLDNEDYVSILRRLSSAGLSGGITYDALLIQAGVKANVDHIFTLNARHFQLVYPEFADRIHDAAEDVAV